MEAQQAAHSPFMDCRVKTTGVNVSMEVTQP